MLKNMAAEQLGDIVLALHNSQPPEDGQWDAYIAICVEATRAANGDYSRVRQLIFTDGGAPNATQRERILAALDKFANVKQAKAALVTSSPIARGIATVATWLGLTAIKAFSPEKVEDACRFLNITPEQVARLKPMVDRLGASLADGVPRSAAFLSSTGAKRPTASSTTTKR